MAKRTIATYQIQVEYKGTKKDFSSLLKCSGYVQKLDVKEIKSETKDLGVIYEGSAIPNEVKTLRLFLKDVCEEAGLKWSKNFAAEEDQYHIRYEYGGRIQFSAGPTHWARLIPDKEYLEITIPVYRRGSKKPVDKLEYEIADPSLHDQLTDLVKKMNRGYHE